MADIIGEINTIGDLLADVGVTRFYKQSLPKLYVANTIGIRWQGDSDADFTQAAYEIERPYQIIYFGASEIDCINKAKAIRSLLSDVIKVKIRDSSDFMTLESFNMSAPFKTDTDGVHAIVGVLSVTVREAYRQPIYPKMAQIDTSLYTEEGISTWDDVEVTSANFTEISNAEWSDIRSTLIDIADEKENGGGV